MMEFLFRIRDLKKHYPVSTGLFHTGGRFLRAVDGVDMEIALKETLGLVGESGCGKTTTGRLMLNLETATHGQILYKGKDLTKMTKSEFRIFHAEVSAVFQDPYESLNPRKRVCDILSTPYAVHDRRVPRQEIKKRVIELLDIVGLQPPELFMNRYPHELSGGQRQRICIARAIALRPKFVVADEPVSSLDVSIRGQIISLFSDLQTKYGLTLLFISHDLAVVRTICRRLAVMYLGRIVEEGPTDRVLDRSLHPYTRSLIAASPIPDPRKRHYNRPSLIGEVPSAIFPPAGCSFNPRCPERKDICTRFRPELVEVEPGHKVACCLVDQKTELR
jgi:oligopeptide/dipeptide ABC transporter ATP-binding protein